MRARAFMVEVMTPDKQWKQVGAVTVSGHIIHGVSQYLDLKDENGDTVVTLTWKSTVRLREVK